MTITWETPPPSPQAGTKRDWPAILCELDARPGEWAVVAEDAASSITRYLKTRHVGYEFTVRGVANGRAAKLYARRVEVAAA